MLNLLTGLQLCLSGALLAMIVTRTVHLLYRAPVSGDAIRWLRDRLEEGDRESLAAWAEQVPQTHVARLLQASQPEQASEEGLDDALAEIRELQLRGLRVLRVGATVASTTGLLIGLLRLRHGFTGSHGLLALEAGLPQRLAMSEALLSMGIGVATAAVCFYALSILRRGAVSLAEQTGSIARRLRSADPG